MDQKEKEVLPTNCHWFQKLLKDKGRLLRVYTQNIDALEMKVGLKSDDVIQVHGTINNYYCINCNAKFSDSLIETQITDGEIPKCEECEGFIKV